MILIFFLLWQMTILEAKNIESIYLQKNADQWCPTGMVWGKRDFKNLRERVLNMKFSPRCIWDTILKDAEDLKGSVRGFSFASPIAVGPIANIGGGSELVVMKNDAENLLVAQVRYRHLSVDISLPIGGGLSQSVIFGDCSDDIDSYLGWFETYVALAKSRNKGRDGIVPFQRDLTGCESISSIRGLNSSIVGVGVSYYELLDGPYLIYGPGVQDLIDHLEKL